MTRTVRNIRAAREEFTAAVHQVVYRLLPGEIVIIAIAHLKRRPGYWKART